MLKVLSRLWTCSVKSISKAQQRQNKKIVKSLLSAAAPAKAAPAKRVRASRVAASAKVAVKSTPAKPAIKAKIQSIIAPGKWLASYYSSFDGDGKLPARRMAYWLYLPDSAKSGPLPLVVMLHGCEQSATQFSQGTRMNQLAEQKGFAVVYPQQSLRSHPNRCWNWYDTATQEGGGDVSMLVGIINKVTQQYAMDRRRIYIAGLSAGAAMANIVALNYPDLIAAVGLHSSPVFGAGHSAVTAYAVMQHGTVNVMGHALQQVLQRHANFPNLPAILIPGQADKVVRPINQVQLAQQFRCVNQLSPETAGPPVLKAAGRVGSANPKHAMKSVDYRRGNRVVLRVCEVLKLEHAWSGGDCAIKFNACAGPDASKMMWDFFVKHRR